MMGWTAALQVLAWLIWAPGSCKVPAPRLEPVKGKRELLLLVSPAVLPGPATATSGGATNP